MEIVYLLIAYLPIISIAAGSALLIAGFVLHKSKRKLSRGLLVAGGFGVGLCLLMCIALFLVGALGIGPVPS